MEQIIKDTRFLYALSIVAATILIVSLIFQESGFAKESEVQTIKKSQSEQFVATVPMV